MNKPNAAVIIAMAALTLLAAACTGSPSSTRVDGPPSAGDSSSSVSQVAYSDCAARGACQHLLPNAGSFQEQASQCTLSGDCPPALVQQMMTIDLKFAHCMRSHGVPNWPDPTIGSGGQPVFKLGKAGITHSQTHSAPMSNTITECQRLDGATLTFGLT